MLRVERAVTPDGGDGDPRLEPLYHHHLADEDGGSGGLKGRPPVDGGSGGLKGRPPVDGG
jgi:hypothetical protein